MTTPEQLLERLEAVERTATGPPAQTGDRVWSAIEARLESGPAPPDLDDGPLLDHAVEAAANVGKASSSVVLKLVGAAAIVGVVAGGIALALRDSEERAPDSSTEVVENSPVEPVVAVTPADLPAAVEPEPEPEPPELSVVPDPAPPKQPTGRTSKTKPVDTPPAAPKSLADEVALMQALSTALKQGDSSKVLKLVAEHERDFAKGQFIEERRAAKARGLCQSGKLAAGKKVAASFASRWPKSIHLASVEQDCGLE